MTEDTEEAVFKALADENRRKLLDLLFRQDGQTLMDLCQHFTMTRHGVMKHLQILEDAGFISTQKVGREKHHYLNPVPIQIAYDRWVSKYAQPWAQGLAGLKTMLEGHTMNHKPAHIYQTYINTTPQKLWQALTDGTFTRQYYMNARVESTWQVGAAYQYIRPTGEVMIAGEILEIDPPHKLVKTFNPMWLDAAERGEPTTVTFEIKPMGDACKLILIHEGLEPPVVADEYSFQAGWAQIFSGLKTLLETGNPLHLS